MKGAFYLTVGLFGIHTIGSLPITSNSHLNGTSRLPENLNVMAAGSQKHFSTKWIGYTGAMVSTLDKPGIGSLGHAQSHLEANGYRNIFGLKQYPVSTANLPNVRVLDTRTWDFVSKPNRCLNTWNKDGQPGKKFAILVGGPPNFSFEPTSTSKGLAAVEQSLKKHYFLPSKHISVIENASSQQLELALKTLEEQIQKSKIKDPEILIYYTGHGGILDAPFIGNADKRGEGEAFGILGLADGALSEYALTSMIRYHLPSQAKITLIMDTCHAGSWIA